jgi:dTDP-4-dehydrorhamnose reductase
MKIIVIGTGFVAQAYLRCLYYLGYHPLVLSRSWLDYTNDHEFEFVINSYKPDVVINCAGYTGSNTVDDCETNARECMAVNSGLTARITRSCSKFKIPLIYISSGCMFNGAGPFDECSALNFYDNEYQNSKRIAEIQVHENYNLPQKYWIFRIRMPFSHIPHKRNWLTKLKNYEKILDGLNSVTWIDQFAMRSWQLWQKAPSGIYHACQLNPVRTLDVARLMNPDVKEYDPKEFLLDNHVPRSAAVLDSSKFEKAYGTQFTDSMTAIRWCIGHLQNQNPDSTNPPSSFFDAVPTSEDLIMSEGASAIIG